MIEKIIKQKKCKGHQNEPSCGHSGVPKAAAFINEPFKCHETVLGEAGHKACKQIIAYGSPQKIISKEKRMKE